MRAEIPSLRPIELQRLRVPGTTDKYTQTTTHTNTDRQTDRRSQQYRCCEEKPTRRCTAKVTETICGPASPNNPRLRSRFAQFRLLLLIVTVLLIFTCYIHLYVCVCHTELKIFDLIFDLLTTDVSCHGKGMYLSAARVRFP